MRREIRSGNGGCSAGTGGCASTFGGATRRDDARGSADADRTLVAGGRCTCATGCGPTLTCDTAGRWRSTDAAAATATTTCGDASTSDPGGFCERTLA